jgi:hypothetical protein
MRSTSASSGRARKSSSGVTDFLAIEKREDLQRLVDEGLEESLTLDYKGAPSLSRDGSAPGELCKDVSALANSGGGQIVYGIEEDKITKKPKRVDGVTDPKITVEWIDQILNSKIQPRLDGVRIKRIEVGASAFAYVVTVPQSRSGPHQAPDQKYYKRFEQQSVPMYDYEIKDVMRRSSVPDLVVHFAFDEGTEMRVDTIGDQTSKPFMLHCIIENRSPQPAFHVIHEVAIDQDLEPSFAIDPFRVTGSKDGKKNVMRVYQRTINSPPDLPIFREGSTDRTNASIALKIPASHLGRHHIFDIESIIQTPGFTGRADWAILCRAGRLMICPPGSPYTKA